MRVGLGYDLHAFAEGRELVLGGVRVPHARGLDGHSDADVLTHALVDAILGAAALGTIGEHFPDSDPKFAGVSSLEADEDPYPEPYDVPPATARLVNHVRAHGGRIIAAGTTVVRALETAALPAGPDRPGDSGDPRDPGDPREPGGQVVASAGWTSHVVTPQAGVKVVDGLLTGLHEPRSSHLRMLAAFAGPGLLSRCYETAIRSGYLWHEFGDVHLLLP